MTWNTKHPVDTRAQRYRVHLVRLVYREDAETGSLAQLAVVAYAGRGRRVHLLSLWRGALALAGGVSARTADAGVLGDYLEEHPGDVFTTSSRAVVLAAARYIQRTRNIQLY